MMSELHLVVTVVAELAGTSFEMVVEAAKELLNAGREVTEAALLAQLLHL